jgi:hypothetical protein
MFGTGTESLIHSTPKTEEKHGSGAEGHMRKKIIYFEWQATV